MLLLCAGRQPIPLRSLQLFAMQACLKAAWAAILSNAARCACFGCWHSWFHQPGLSILSAVSMLRPVCMALYAHDTQYS